MPLVIDRSDGSSCPTYGPPARSLIGSAGSVHSGSTILQVLDAPLEVDPEPDAEVLAGTSKTAAAATSEERSESDHNSPFSP